MAPLIAHLCRYCPQSRTMSRIIHLFLPVTVVFLSGCDFVTGKVSLSDPALAPMLQAIAAVDRAALGFSPIPTNAVVHLDSRSGARYDAMLHIYNTPALHDGIHRIIEFRKTATGYKWILEAGNSPRPEDIHPERPYIARVDCYHLRDRGPNGTPARQAVR